MPRISLWISGFLVATGLMVGDELITLAGYCGIDCRYPIPLLAPQGWHIYDAYGFAWTLILAGLALLLLEVLKNPQPRS